MNPEYCDECHMDYRDKHLAHTAIHKFREKLEGKPMQVPPVKKTSSGPPSERTIQRIMELKDHELFTDEDREWLHGCIFKSNMLATQGQAGIIVSAMKRKINARGGNV